MASQPAESRDDQWTRLEEVEEYADSQAKRVLGVGAIHLVFVLLLFVLLCVGGWLSGEKVELGPWTPGQKWVFAISWLLGGVAALSFLWGLCCRWMQRRRAGKFLGPLDVRQRRPTGVGKPFSILIKQPVSRPVRIERLEVSLVCVEDTYGVEVLDEGLLCPFIDRRDLYSQTRHFGLEDRQVPAGAAPEALAEFDIPDATRTQLNEQVLVARELFEKRKK